MIKRGYYFMFIKHFFGLRVTKRKYLVHLAVSAALRTLAFLVVPFMASEVIEGLEKQDFEYTFFAIGMFLLSAVVYLFCHRYNYWAYYINARSIHNILQQKILRKVLEFDVCFSAGISKATLVSTAFRDVDHARQTPDFLCDTIVSIFGILIATIILCFADLRIGAILVVLITVSLADFFHHTKKRDQSRTEMLGYADELAGLYSQVIDGYKEVQTLNLEKELSAYQKKTKMIWSKYFHAERIHRDLAASVSPVLVGIGRVIIYLICASLILSGEYDVAMLILVLGYYEEIMQKYDEICNNIDNISRSYVAIERLYRLLNVKTSLAVMSGMDRTDKIVGNVIIKEVSFNYKRPAEVKLRNSVTKIVDGRSGLNNVSLSAIPGKLTAIVGKSGSGKSTILRLLLRFYEIDKGEILLDGRNIYDYTEEVYAKNVSLMSQKPFVFDMTIRENLGLVDNNHKHQIEVCKKIGIHNEIMKLPKGYNTVLERDGANLSTGQKQLLSLARVLLSKAEVLLFDEVTSSLDGATTDRIIDLLARLKKDHTIIMVTHKPELMRIADQIVVIDKGRVAGKGTHRELLQNSNIYRDLQKLG